jgi:hypothetical protein
VVVKEGAVVQHTADGTITARDDLTTYYFS